MIQTMADQPSVMVIWVQAFGGRLSASLDCITLRFTSSVRNRLPFNQISQLWITSATSALDQCQPRVVLVYKWNQKIYISSNTHSLHNFHQHHTHNTTLQTVRNQSTTISILMSIVPVEVRNINVDDGVLPCAAAKLVVTQYFDYADNTHWAWIIVGTFLDHHDRPLWSTEIFLARLEPDSDSESRFGDSDFDAGESTTELYDGNREEEFGSGESDHGPVVALVWLNLPVVTEQWYMPPPVCFHDTRVAYGMIANCAPRQLTSNRRRTNGGASRSREARLDSRRILLCAISSPIFQFPTFFSQRRLLFSLARDLGSCFSRNHSWALAGKI